MDPADLSYALPRHLYYQVVHALRLALPPPASDQPLDLLHRDRAAIAQVAAMLPANAEEAMLAAQVVAAGAQALDCLRLFRRHEADMLTGLKCSAQAASMMRQANAGRSLLMRLQAAREKREAHQQRCDAAASIEHCAIGLMSDMLESMPSAATPRDTATHSSAAPVSNRAPARSAEPTQATPVPGGSPVPHVSRIPAPPAQVHRFAPHAAAAPPCPSQDDAAAPRAGRAHATAPVSPSTPDDLLTRPTEMEPAAHHRPIALPRSESAREPGANSAVGRGEDKQTTPSHISRPARWTGLGERLRETPQSERSPTLVAG